MFLKPLRVDMVFVFERPKGHFGTGRNAGKLKASAPKFYAVKPDYDNNCKFTLDAMNSAVYKDDAQICGGFTWQRYADHGEMPHTTIKITELE